MKLLAGVSCEDERAASASYAIVDLTDDVLAAIKRYRGHAYSILKAEGNTLNHIAFFANHCAWLGVTAMNDDPGACHEYLRSALRLTEEQWCDVDLGGSVRIADNLEIPRQFVQSVEMNQIRVWADGFCYSSVPKGSSVTQFVDLRYELLE